MTSTFCQEARSGRRSEAQTLEKVAGAFAPIPTLEALEAVPMEESQEAAKAVRDGSESLGGLMSCSPPVPGTAVLSGSL